jgi:2'-hydroxyisoflavone reductase
LFLGRHVVSAALAKGHDITIFTRGRTNPALFPDVQALRGDRDADVSALRGGRWDAVVDTSAYLPRQVDATAAALTGRVDLYCLVSSVSVYPGFPTQPVSEWSVTHPPLEDPAATLRPETYGPLKVGCEQALMRVYGDGAFIVRPGILVGPSDPSGRLRYWTERISKGGEVLAPGDPAHPVQLLDARDLAEWIVNRLEWSQAGIFNTAGPAAPLTMASLLDTCRAVAESDATFRWASDAFLLEHDVRPSADLPLWQPSDAPGTIDDGAARALGLRHRPFVETVSDVLADDADAVSETTRPTRPVAISREREQELLSLLHRTASSESG